MFDPNHPITPAVFFFSRVDYQQAAGFSEPYYTIAFLDLSLSSLVNPCCPHQLMSRQEFVRLRRLARARKGAGLLQYLWELVPGDKGSYITEITRPLRKTTYICTT